MNMERLLRSNRKEILETATRHGASRVRVFGSIARGTADDASDIDFLVDLAPDRGLLDLGSLLYDLRQLLGVEVDVVTGAGLRKRFREKILAEAVDL